MNEVWICSAKRTAIGAFMGSLKDIPAVDLGAIVAKAILAETGVPPAQISELIAGCALPAGQGMNPARQIALKAGLPVESTAFTVNRVCGSGLQAVVSGAQEILLGEADLILAGGIENMSRAPYLLPKARAGFRLGNETVVDGMIGDGLWDVFTDEHMGITAENLAAKYGISRQEQDDFALTSQRKAGQAIREGRFQEEIVPVLAPQGKGEPNMLPQAVLFQIDEHVRLDASPEKLARLRPAFKKDGTVTVGNSSGINDGAAFVLLASGNRAKELGLRPLAIIRSWAVAGVDPSAMGLGPVPATRKALTKAGVLLDQVEFLELNEAFAAQSLAVLRELQISPERVNLNGGAIALGHPIGASGARILVTLLHEMEHRPCPTGGQVCTGLAALCIGGGQGIALLAERV
ncbi:MAG: acetyl-CoA C-acetyltransferase [bacterium]